MAVLSVNPQALGMPYSIKVPWSGFWNLLWASLSQRALPCAAGLLLSPEKDAELRNVNRKYKLDHILTCV